MQYTRLGSTGMQVSRICLGTMSFGNSEEWMVEDDKARPIVNRALDLGVNFFDAQAPRNALRARLGDYSTRTAHLDRSWGMSR